MSSLIAVIRLVDKVEDLVGSERLSLVFIEGWVVVSSKLQDGSHRYKKGDPLIYLAPDTQLDNKLMGYLFPEDSKIKAPEGGRLKAIKIRGAVSYGMSIDLTPELEELYPGILSLKVGDSVVDILGLKKWEPTDTPGCMTADADSNHPQFKKYTDIENIKNFNNVFVEGEEVSVVVKIHGSNWRGALLPKLNATFFEKVKAFLTCKPLTTFCVGSHNRRIKLDGHNKDVYARVAEKYDVLNKLRVGEEVFGEAVSSSIQKGFGYGVKPGDVDLYLFDVMVDGVYLSRDAFVQYCDERGFKSCPEVYRGPFSKAKMEELASGKDHELDKGIPCREGIVIRLVNETINPYVGRVVLKQLNPEYLLLKNSTDFH